MAIAVTQELMMIGTECGKNIFLWQQIQTQGNQVTDLKKKYWLVLPKKHGFMRIYQIYGPYSMVIL